MTVPMGADEPMGPIRRLIGVYDADGTLRGELTYWIGARLGRAHCSLCDITHSSVRMRADWKRCTDALPVPFDTFHRDDQPAAVRAASGDRVPAVVAETDTGLHLVVGPEEIERCAGSIERLMSAIDAALAARAGTW